MGDQTTILLLGFSLAGCASVTGLNDFSVAGDETSNDGGSAGQAGNAESGGAGGSAGGMGGEAPGPCGDAQAYGGHCYTMFAGPASYDDATLGCAAWRDGATLVILTDLEENLFARSMASIGDRTWIGLDDLAPNDDIWQWVDGTPLGYDDWAAGQPNNGSEACAVMRGDGTGWHDFTCNQGFGYLCEVALP